ncbi:hypothetical protein BBAD15_g10217 [Beauveria bassiana D1-5]|uniref:Uncharacterized protein n=1 Tax=Beauveria bassiana D1-5 TaxID=1245745 RepID=A0A0A2VUT1_BEABA|nr:hypothetical protein BBAD15_g10217 [Beauveria bassiana D1-5]
MQLPPHMPSAEQIYNKMIYEQMPDIQSNFLLESNGGDGTKVLKVLEVIPLILISTTERVRRGSGLGSNEASRLKLCRCAALMGYRDQPTLSGERDERPQTTLVCVPVQRGQEGPGPGRTRHIIVELVSAAFAGASWEGMDECYRGACS